MNLLLQQGNECLPWARHGLGSRDVAVSRAGGVLAQWVYILEKTVVKKGKAGSFQIM